MSLGMKYIRMKIIMRYLGTTQEMRSLLILKRVRFLLSHMKSHFKTKFSLMAILLDDLDKNLDHEMNEAASLLLRNLEWREAEEGQQR